MADASAAGWNLRVQPSGHELCQAAGQITGMADAMDNSGDQIAVRLTPIPPTPGDSNCDDVVNVDDLLAVLMNWGAPGGGGGYSPADFNHDGTVNLDDLLIVLMNWS